MAKTFYLPTKDNEKAVWLNNFALKFAAMATSFGFTAADVTAVNNYASMFAWLLNVIEMMTNSKENFVNYKNLLRSGPISSPTGIFPVLPVLSAQPPAVAAGIFPMVTKIVQRIKKHPNYTEALGMDLGIIGAEQTIDSDTLKPTLKLVFKGGQVEVRWRKGKADAIRIEVDRTGSGWQFLAIDAIPHYTDIAPITAAATWKYRAMFLIADELVGQWSDEVSITVG